MNKDHKELKRDSVGVAGVATAPLRVAKPGGKPLWMEETDAADDRLTEAIGVVESTERKATHWTLNDRGDSQPSKGDGGA